MFNRARNFEVGIVSSETISFLILRQLWFQSFKGPDVTVIWNFHAGIETTICGVRVTFRHPFAPNSLFAAVLCHLTGFVGALKRDFIPGRGKP